MHRLRQWMGLTIIGIGMVSTGTAWGQTPASVLIRGGTVVDGTGAKGRVEDVRVQGERIAAVGRLRPLPGERVDRGAAVWWSRPASLMPTSHADGGLLEDPNAETMIRQGITTSVVGQDGSSHFPLKDYFSQLESTHVALNIASFVGHGTMRQQVMGEDYKRASTPDETAKMQALVAQEMDAGRAGAIVGPGI